MASDLKGPSLGGSRPRAARRDRVGDWDGVVDRGGVLAAAVEAAAMPMVLSDPNRPDNPIVFANPAFLRMSGYDRSEVVGRNCRFLQGPESDPDAVEVIRRGVGAREEVAVELLNYRKDGTPFWNALFIAPVFGPGGELVHFFASQLDVSRRRVAEEALLRAAPGWQAQPIGRTDRAAPSSGRPVADVAHDLNNMLQVVAGHMDAFGRHAASSGDARLLRRLRAASEAADRAVALTRELLTGARGPEPGRAGGAGWDDPIGGREARPGPAVERRGERVLVVDDRAEVAELARAMLESAGYAVEVAGGGREALEKLRGGFDLLFSDLVMPGGLDGVSLAREAQRRDPLLKVLLTTGRVGPGSAPAQIQADASADRDGRAFETITKPYRRAELVETVRRLLDRPVGAG